MVFTGKAQVVLTWDGSDPRSPKALLSKPGVVVRMVVADGELEALMADPQMQAYCDSNTPVVLDFESVADAAEFQRRMTRH